VADSVNRQWLLASRPKGMVGADNFELRESAVPEPGDGEFVVRNLYLSLDPAMRGWISEQRSYIPPVQIGEVMRGGCVGRVEESRHPDYSTGDLVLGFFGWQDYAVSDGNGGLRVTKIPPGVSPTMPLSVLGLTTLTAYWGLKEIGKPQAGDTVVVSGAAGATGSVVGQLAKLEGARTIGIAGGPEKCRQLSEEFGFDEAIDYKAQDVGRALAELCPDGLNVYWDNVGGEILEAALANLALRSRVVLCGAISVYNEADSLPPGPRTYLNLLVTRSRMEGFIVLDYFDRTEEAMAELVPLVLEGKIRYREDIRDGLETAPSALVDLYTGGNTGKLLVKIAEP
jgi:NADPH-dependent curcumin reductase CurA